VVGLLLRLRCLLRSEAPDVLYTFLGVPNLAGVAMKLLVPGIRCLASVRASNMDMTRYGLLARLCCSAEAKLVRFADRIVANSYAGAECAVTRGMPGRKITVVPNGIDVETFRPARPAGESLRREWGVGSGDVLVGMPARLDPMKDHETFVRAAAIAAGRDHRMRFVCVGEERSPLGSSLRELGRSLGLGDRLIWAGRRDDMVSVYNSLDVCCLSSAYGEGFSNVLGEAMACGVPCVATDVGDAARIVGTAGAIVPPGDPEALAGALIAMAARGERAPVLALRESVVERFSIPAMLDRTEAVIRELAEA
jgi:glycosyltransferase involved in cell wall biosynthesis